MAPVVGAKAASLAAGEAVVAWKEEIGKKTAHCGGAGTARTGVRKGKTSLHMSFVSNNDVVMQEEISTPQVSQASQFLFPLHVPG